MFILLTVKNSPALSADFSLQSITYVHTASKEKIVVSRLSEYTSYFRKNPAILFAAYTVQCTQPPLTTRPLLKDDLSPSGGARGKGRLPSADTNVDCLAIFPTLFLHSTNQLNQQTKNIGVNK